MIKSCASDPYNPIVCQDATTCMHYVQQQLLKDAATTTTTPVPVKETFKFGVIGYCWGACKMKYTYIGLLWSENSSTVTLLVVCNNVYTCYRVPHI